MWEAVSGVSEKKDRCCILITPMSPEESLQKLHSESKASALEALNSLESSMEEGWEPDEASIKSLIDGLAHPVWIVRSKLFELLARFHEKVLPYLGDALVSENEDLQYWTLQVYASVAERTREQVSTTSDAAEKKRLSNFLGRIIRRLTSAAPKMSESNLQALLTGLGRVKEESLIPFLLEQLSSNRWVIRSEASRALMDIGSPVVPHVRKLILEGSRDQSYWSFVILGNLLAEKAIDPFYRVISSKEYSEEVRIYALAGLKQIQSASIIPYLIKCLSSDLWILRAQASETLILYKEEVTDSLLECLSSKDQNVRFWALKTLAEVVTERDIDKIEDYLKMPDQELRFYTISALAKIGSERSIRCISTCFSDEAWMIRKHAADSLVALGEVVIQPLVSILRENQDLDEKIFWILQIFSALKVRTVLPALRQLLMSGTRDYRLYATRAIAQIPGEESVELLIAGFSSEFWVIRNECYRELIKIEGTAPALLCFPYLKHEDPSLRYWIHRFFAETPLEGARQLAEELKGLEIEEIKRFSESLQNLQETPLNNLFRLSTASLQLGYEYLSDPFKIKEGKVKTVEPGPIPPGVLLPTLTPLPAESNVFHFEDPQFAPFSIELPEILEKMVFLGASDLHLKPLHPPRVRVNGRIQSLDLPALNSNQLRDLIRKVLPVPQQRKFCDKKQLDWAYTHPGGERFRVNLFLSHKGVEAAFRHVRSRIPTFADLHLPEDSFEKLSRLEHGLILITGVTGAGKSSTLASIIGAINRRDSKHIICIEDPIEYVHKDQKSMVVHREIGEHVDSFLDGLRGCLREDPDVVLVGEMRDRETVKSVLTLAGTGHLVLSTFHTSSAPQTIEQIIQFFPAEERLSICSQLSFCLQAVISQVLVEDSQALGRIPALEMMMGTQAVRNLIREGKTEQLFSAMQTAGSEGMYTREQYLKNILQKGKISREVLEIYVQG